MCAIILALLVAFSHSLCAAGCLSKQPETKLPPCHQQAPSAEACPYQADADRTMEKASVEPAVMGVVELPLIPALRPLLREAFAEPETPPPPKRCLTPLRI